jgi:hypothetical protein
MGVLMARYWFRQKRFGYGATPATWQGWTLSVAAVVLAAGVVLAAPAIRDNLLRPLFVVLGLTLVIGVASAVAWRKTEGGWHWRGWN